MGTQISKLLINCRQNITISDLSGKIVGFDAYNTIYAFLARIRDKSTGGGYFTDSDGHVTSHLLGLFPRLTYFLQNDIKPVFIFDGKPPIFKAKEISYRKNRKKIAEIKRATAIADGKLEEASKFAQATSKLTPDILKDTKTLLQLLGIPFIQAPSEAEAQGAMMNQRGLIQAMASQDYDSFLFGCPIVIRNLGVSQRRKIPNQPKFVEISTEQIILKELLQELGLKSREQLILLGILVGTDYNPKGIKGIGPKTAIKLVREYPNLNSLQKYLESKYSLEEILPYSLATLLDCFKSPESDPNLNFAFSKPQPKKLSEFLVGDREFKPERIRNSLKILERLSKQSKLDQFFGN
ncbi:MAG: flap endonuclease-1 [Candidatus Heimdallarchaeota archaeon]|nr:flap endonuclease-1 [Candidatus Heimdallarchaeota archaeon]